ncbi:MAG: S8 family serine peptidase [Phycisphaerales bacterium]|nr:S8 family serine peptidase [Phycisphaerales bacterium]
MKRTRLGFRSLAAVIALAASATVGAADQQSAVPAGDAAFVSVSPLRLRVRTLDGPILFDVANGAATSSPAVQVARTTAEQTLPERHRTYILTDRVMFRLLPGIGIEQFTLRHNLGAVRALFADDDIYDVSAESVRAAAALADRLAADAQVRYAYIRSAFPAAPMDEPEDPLYVDQWHLENTVEGDEHIDANVRAAWDVGVDGDNGGEEGPVIVCTVDDGLDWEHEDFADDDDPPNPLYRADLSWDFNEEDDNPDHEFSYEGHGTCVTGVMAARANDRGVRGAAYAADFCALRMLGGPLYEEDYQTIFEFGNNPLDPDDVDEIDIKNNSWGRVQEWRVRPLYPYARAGLETAITWGRGGDGILPGKGVIFCFAAGNGYMQDGRADYGGLNSSRYVITVGAIADDDIRSWYSVRGSSILVGAHSNGGSRGITTCDPTGSDGYTSGDYYSSFGGTSSASPLAAGVVALMLDANPDLTWRDVQHILVRTARKNDPGGEGGDSPWETNGAGHDISYSYGFGAVDAAAAAARATLWGVAGLTSDTSTTVSSLIVDPEGPPVSVPTADPPLELIAQIDVEGVDCDVDPVEIVEHVELHIETTGGYRGDLEIKLIAPTGTESLLAETRDDEGDYEGPFVFTSVRHWDECPDGEWIVRILDGSGDDGTDMSITGLELVIYLGGVTTGIPGDIDNDGDVDQQDLGILLATYDLPDDHQHWNPDADLDGDGDVDQQDLGILLAYYGIGT